MTSPPSRQQPTVNGSAPGRQTLLVLGASGDLAARLLLPGLGALVATDDAPDLSLVGVGREDWDEQRWRFRVRDSFATVSANDARATSVADQAGYLCADVTQEQDLRRLLDACSGRVVIFSPCRRRSPRKHARLWPASGCRRGRGWCWKSLSVRTRTPPVPSTNCSPGSCPKSRSTGSTTSSASRPC